ncbi:LOW QUALITY PROTEIN: uncharacterized protein [Watersipora subatra]|uniref:LOW QUALITY PROTEIN: uncharacterized protein n=1 Tax=Watersipora subatra TaxID=2589382 RepID=UPI00355C8012
MAETSMSSMRRAMDMGEKLGLKDAELDKFIEENEPKFAAEIEREERRMGREAKKEAEAEDRQLQHQMQMKQMEIDSRKQARELEMQREIEEKRLAHELEIKKLEVENIRMDDSKNESTGLEWVSNKPKPLLSVFDEKTDDMDSYLQRFEWIAENYQWDKAEWSFHLSQYLKGKATETYTRMVAENRKDYDQVKEALLKRYNFTEEGYRKRFRESKAKHDETPQQFLVRLRTYIDKWVELSNCKDLKKLNLREQFIAACPTNLAVHLKEMKFDRCVELAEAADRYLTAHARKMSFIKKTTPNETTITGHSYNEKGHIANRCNKKPQKYCAHCKMNNHNTTECRRLKTPTHKAGVAEGETNPEGQNTDEIKLSWKRYVQVACCKGKVGKMENGVNLVGGYVNGKQVEMIRDTGCTTVVVKKSLVKADQYTGEEGYLRMADNTARKLPFAKISIDTPFYQGDITAMVIETPIHDLMLGNISGARSPFVSNENIEVNREDLIKSQREDDSLKRLYDATEAITKGKQQTRFMVKKDILYREYHHPGYNSGQPIKQVVVPKTLRVAVMRHAHNSLLSGHLGIRKTIDRILTNFFWPGLHDEVARFCRSCDICQRNVKKGSVQKVPLHRTPLIETPFKRCAVNLIGPINPPSEKRHRYILTLVDYATRYPEAVPLKEISSEAVAEALIDIYSRVGIPEEVISDRGTQFISEYMEEFARLLGMKQMPTTPYHAMANGLVERFIGTLKSMLKNLCHQEPRQWHRYINPALFAYREVPQESTGFSPFELLYGRTIRGPMDILRQLWTQDDAVGETKSSYQHVFDLRAKLEDTMELAQKALEGNKQRYKHYFDKKAKKREFQKGDKVLILLPTNHNKLLMHWQGPYNVEEKVGINAYQVQVKGKSRTYHANMLKKYYVRDSEKEITEAAGIGEVEEEEGTLVELYSEKSVGTVKDLKMGENISDELRKQITDIVKDYTDIFTDRPGNCNLIKHPITLTSNKPIKSKPYTLPYVVRESLREDIKDILNTGIIRESNSPYASPVVLVKKPDGSNRLCADYRNLNKITVFDPEPMTTASDLFQKMSGDHYFSKLRATKGYWQIPVEKSDIPKTAFVTPDGQYEFIRMPFGMVNSGATFVPDMKKLLKDLPGVDNYIGDIIVHTAKLEDHMDTLRELFTRLAKVQLTIKPTKCYLGGTSIEFLGHKIDRGELKPMEDNVEKITEAPRPLTKTQVWSFLGLTGYYREFVPNYAVIASPLSDLTKKGQPNKVIWTDAQEKAYRKLRATITEKPVLKLPDITKQFTLRTDASDTGLGAVLLQEHDRKIFPVSYASRKLLDRERNYSTIEKECLAIVWAVKKYLPYLYGVEFILQTNHQPLTYINRAKYENSRVMRWALYLQDYRMTVESIKGKDNVEADYMSRIDSES